MLDVCTYQTAAKLLDSGRTSRSRESRKLGNNTYLHRIDADTIAVRYHATDVVVFHSDNTTSLYTRGWYTITTKQRINHYSRAWVWSRNGEWQLGIIGHTPERQRKCAGCHGVPWDDSELGLQLMAMLGKHPATDHPAPAPSWWSPSYGEYTTRCAGCVRPCGRCAGTGRETVGGKPIGVPFEDGITINDNGEVI